MRTGWHRFHKYPGELLQIKQVLSIRNPSRRVLALVLHLGHGEFHQLEAPRDAVSFHPWPLVVRASPCTHPMHHFTEHPQVLAVVQGVSVSLDSTWMVLRLLPLRRAPGGSRALCAPRSSHRRS